MKNLDHRLAWLAGIIDGEGCISHRLARMNYVRKRDGVQSVGLDFKVSIANTDILMVEEVTSIASAIGTKCLKYCHSNGAKSRSTGRSVWKPVWHVSFDSGKRVEAVLAATLPYLVTKRDRAERTLAVIRYWRKARWTKGRQGGLSPSDDAWLMQQLGDLKHLNRRGPDAVEAR